MVIVVMVLTGTNKLEIHKVCLLGHLYRVCHLVWPSCMPSKRMCTSEVAHCSAQTKKQRHCQYLQLMLIRRKQVRASCVLPAHALRELGAESGGETSKRICSVSNCTFPRESVPPHARHVHVSHVYRGTTLIPNLRQSCT